MAVICMVRIGAGMPMKTNERLLSELEPARELLEAWRRTRKHREPIPGEVWEKVVPLARTHGVNPVAVALRLNYHALRHKVDVANTRAQGRNRSEPLSFVELSASPKVAIPTEAACVLEVADHRGRTLTLRLGDSGRIDAVKLVDAFCRSAR